jgi:TPR repeat protein
MRRSSAAVIPVISFLTFLMAGSILADPLEDSTKAYRRGDYKTAYQLVKPLAEKGDVAAQSNLGLMYSKGQGVPLEAEDGAVEGNSPFSAVFSLSRNISVTDVRYQLGQGN